MEVKVKRLGHVVMFNAVGNSLKQQTETNENAVCSAQMQGYDGKKGKSCNHGNKNLTDRTLLR